jgi:hypothetical protein
MMTDNFFLHLNLDSIYRNLEKSLWKCIKCTEPNELEDLPDRIEGLLKETKSIIEGMGRTPPKTPEVRSTSAWSAKSVREEICKKDLNHILELCTEIGELDKLKVNVKALQNDLMDTQIVKS